MRRATLALALSLPLVFAALPLGSLLFAERGDQAGTLVTVTETVPGTQLVAEEDPALAMRQNPDRDCPYTSSTHIDS